MAEAMMPGMAPAHRVNEIMGSGKMIFKHILRYI
jgi:hypothetical protein